LAKNWRSRFAERAIALMAKFETRENARALEAQRPAKPQWTASATSGRNRPD